VLDIFAGSNTTGFAAQNLARKWISFEIDSEYVRSSALRFLNNDTDDSVHGMWRSMESPGPTEIRSAQLALFEKTEDPYSTSQPGCEDIGL
jgi:site-specific DNA-methyltransferase (cytosine-N4-specific)